MTRNTKRTGFDTDEEFFRYHLARHGRDRSLSALWQLFHGAAAFPAAVPAEPFLQGTE